MIRYSPLQGSSAAARSLGNRALLDFGLDSVRRGSPPLRASPNSHPHLEPSPFPRSSLGGVTAETGWSVPSSCGLIGPTASDRRSR